MDRAKEIVILSGKGGTGKTTLAASLSKLIPDKVIVDADVDASDLFILLKPDLLSQDKFKGGSVASIDTKKCIQCGECEKKCRFSAISRNKEGNFVVDSYKCEGCEFCTYICPVNAIKMNPQIVGNWYVSETSFGTMVHARLIPGAENSGNLVALVKREAQLIAKKKGLKSIIVDGPPGIGCPVISSLSGAALALIVTEPTLSGIHDLDRILSTCKQFNVNAKIIINKADINQSNTEKIQQFANENGLEIMGKIPFDRCVVKNLSKNLTPIDSNNCEAVKKEIKKISNDVLRYLSE